MKQQIKLTEQDLHRIIKEAVDSYDWESYELDPELNKSIDNSLSWEEKDFGDDEAMEYMDIDHFHNPHVRKYKSRYPAYQSVYDNGLRGPYKDYSDKYYTDSDYHFTHDQWKEDGGMKHDYFIDDDLANPNSYYNKDYTNKSVGESKKHIRLKESQLHRIIKESVKTILMEHGRGNDWDKRSEWNNFEDPLVTKNKESKMYGDNKNKCNEIIKNCSEILSSQWFKLLEKYGRKPILSIQVINTDDGDLIRLKDSNDINELVNFCKENYNIQKPFDIFGYFYCDDAYKYDWGNLSHKEIAVKENLPEAVVEILYNIDDCFNVLDYGYYKPKLNAVLKKYINRKRQKPMN